MADLSQYKLTIATDANVTLGTVTAANVKFDDVTISKTQDFYHGGNGLSVGQVVTNNLVVNSDANVGGTFNFGNGSVVINSVSGDINLGDGNVTIDNTGNITVAKDIIPVTDNTSDLGSPTNRFRHLYVAPGTIYLGDVKLINNNGKLEAKKVINPGEENEEEDTEDSDAFSQVRGGGGGSTGSIQFEASILTSPNGISPWYNGVITLAPGAQSTSDYENNGQFINVYPTWDYDEPHIHIAAGTGTNGTGDLILGPDNYHIDINHNGNIYVKTNNQTKTWTFDDTGAITFPDGTTQSTAYVTPQQYGYINQFVHSSNDNVDMEAVAMDSNGNSYVSYSFYDDNDGYMRGGVMKLNSTGSVQWNITLGSSSGNPQYPKIASLEYTTVNANDFLVAIGTYYDNNSSKDRGFMWLINPSDGSVGEEPDIETDTQVPVDIQDAVFGSDAEGAPFAVLVGYTYNETLQKTFTPLAGSGMNKLVVSWSEFNASGALTGETIYYTVGGSYNVRLNAFDTVATLDGTGDGLYLQVRTNQDGTYSILRVNGYSGVIGSWGNPVNVRVLGSNLGGVNGTNDLTFDLDYTALQNNSNNIAGWASNIQGTAISDVVALGNGDKDWSTEIGNTLTFDYQLNRQAYIARLGNNSWGKSIGSTEYESLNTVVVDSNGNSYAAGYYWNGTKASIVIKFDIDGNQEWAVYIDPANNSGNDVTSIDLLSDGDIITVDEEGYVTKIDSDNGTIIWQVRVDPNDDISWDSDFKGTATPDGNYIFTNYEDNDYTLYVLCVSGTDGSEIWSKRITRTFGGSNGEIYPQDDFDAQYIDCNNTSVTIAASTYLYFNNNGTYAGLIINFPVDGENTDGVYGQYIIESVSPGYNTESTTSTSAVVNSTSTPVTTSGASPVSSNNTFAMTENIIGESTTATVAGIERHSTSTGDNTITLADEHNGKFLYYKGSDGTSTIRIPSNNDVALPIGYTVTVVMDDFNNNRIYVNNNTGSQSATINASGFQNGTGNYWQFGASADKCGVYTIMKVDTDRWMLAGPDITVD